MKTIKNIYKTFIVIVLLVGSIVGAQSIDYNTKKGYAIKGYDVVAYFDSNSQLGNEKYTATYDKVKYKFFNQENLDKFNANPVAYLPQYGGYCAYAVAVAGKKVNVNPETYEIRNNKLYLFYNSGKNNTLKSWIKESPKTLIPKADKNWAKIK